MRGPRLRQARPHHPQRRLEVAHLDARLQRPLQAVGRLAQEGVAGRRRDGRCLGLLEAVPELRPHLPAMADESPVWAALVARWDELERLFAEEAPTGRCPKLYALMKELGA